MEDSLRTNVTIQEVVGACVRCGNPIYAFTGPWWSVLPPPPIRTCGCFWDDVVATDSTSLPSEVS
jgi:hypothetical protein